jgi:hypothetical protein
MESIKCCYTFKFFPEDAPSSSIIKDISGFHGNPSSNPSIFLAISFHSVPGITLELKKNYKKLSKMKLGKYQQAIMK